MIAILTNLRVENIALAERLDLSFGPGMNLLTGETGAGKSIIINAISLCMGGRVDRDMIRTGATRAYVEAIFQVDAPNERLQGALAECGGEIEEGCLILSREIQQGRTQCRVNGRAMPLTAFRRVGACLVDIHGQHEHQFLLDPANHLEFLDRLGEEPVRLAREEVAARYQQWHAAAQELARMQADERDRRQRLDMLAFQMEELDEAQLKPGEEEEQQRLRSIAQHGEKILSALSATYGRLYDGEGKRAAITDVLRELSQRMAEAANYMPEIAPLALRIEEAFYSLEDVALEARALQEGLDYDPAAADRMGARLDQLHKLQRKYGATVEEMLAYRREIGAEYERLINWDESLERLIKERKRREEALIIASRALTELRRDVARRLQAQLLDQLRELGMGKCAFETRFLELEDAGREGRFGPNGWDRVEFYLSTNPGEPLKPLARVASGGELSRIMLAFKSIGADIDDIPCLVFDEVDTGISGRMAQVVGEKIACLSDKRQILCVTHLPQIASLADAHYLIRKEERAGRTAVRVLPLAAADRVEEISRLTGGEPGDPVAREHARNLIERGRRFRGKKD